MGAGSHSLSSVLEDYARLISTEWMVWILLLISMMLQLVLVVLGARRYHCSGAIFRFVVWGAYISADAVAISALGTMMYSARSGIYGISAPVLLLHLGGPDAITAYSMADNELWLRHGFNMVYQVSVALYVIYSSALEGYALVSALLLLFAGATKYAERTLALLFASYSQIVRSCLPICKYMKEKDVVQDRGYAVMGEKQLQKIVEKNLSASPKDGSGSKAVLKAASVEGIEKETSLEAASVDGGDIEVGVEAASAKGRGIVTTEDVKNAALRRIDSTENLEHGLINEEYYNLCLSHALFKMYMRRFVSLSFEEGDWKETRVFWDKLKGKDAFRIVERELKFMYDALFSKGSRTAFSRFGILLRLLNCILVGAAGFLILRERQHREPQRTVTYVVISVALGVEVFQFCRIMTSDWTRVRLICAQIENIKHPLSKVIEIALLVLGKVQNVVRGDSYWSNRIHQHCLIGTWLKRSLFIWRMANILAKADIYFASWLVHKVFVEDELKDFIFDILTRKCRAEDDSETCRDRIYYFEEDLLEEESEIGDVILSHDSLEEVILAWHIATAICDRERESPEQGENKNALWSIILSKYCVYLIVSRPHLLPVHPDMARITYMQLVEELVGEKYHGKDHRELLKCRDQNVLGSGAELARKLMRKGEEERWKLLAEYWAGLVIYMAVYNKASFHAECLAGGGEFLSQVWVLLGHIGCGEQSDSAVRKKIESSLEGERRERVRIKRERRERERERRDRERVERIHREWVEERKRLGKNVDLAAEVFLQNIPVKQEHMEGEQMQHAG